MGVENGGVRYIVGWGADGDDDSTDIPGRGMIAGMNSLPLPPPLSRKGGVVGAPAKLAPTTTSLNRRFPTPRTSGSKLLAVVRPVRNRANCGNSRHHLRLQIIFPVFPPE